MPVDKPGELERERGVERAGEREPSLGLERAGRGQMQGVPCRDEP